MSFTYADEALLDRRTNSILQQQFSQQQLLLEARQCPGKK